MPWLGTWCVPNTVYRSDLGNPVLESCNLYSERYSFDVIVVQSCSNSIQYRVDTVKVISGGVFKSVDTRLDSVESLINPLESLINLVESLINPLESLINPLEALIRLFREIVEHAGELRHSRFHRFSNSIIDGVRHNSSDFFIR